MHHIDECLFTFKMSVYALTPDIRPLCPVSVLTARPKAKLDVVACVCIAVDRGEARRRHGTIVCTLGGGLRFAVVEA